MSHLLRRWSASTILQLVVWLIVLALAVALPVARFGLDSTFHTGSLTADAQARAQVVSQRIAQNPQMWVFEVHRLESSVNQDLLGESSFDHRVLRDDHGKLILENDRASLMQWPVLNHRQPLFDNGRVVGSIELSRSLRAEVQHATALGLATLVIGTALAWLLVRVPLRHLRRVEEELEFKAFHDDLTGLYNREALRRLLTEQVAMAGRERARLAVLVVDLDRFKAINDSMGHDAGNEALCMAAKRLQQCALEGDIVARLSGDEFAVVTALPHGDGTLLAQTVIKSFEEPIELMGRSLHLGCSLGLALYPEHAQQADRLLACADTAMQHAKANGRSLSRTYSETMEESVLRRLQVEEDLRDALARQEFVLHYQPLVCMATGRTKGCEALLRWKHPQRGLVPPIEFIPLLEEMSLIHSVGRWVLHEACSQMCRWQAQGLGLDYVAVNVSPLQFARQDDFVAEVREVLAEVGLPSAKLQLELTEGTLMQHDAAGTATLNALRALGVTLSIDDFGTGYSSLAYLRSFPVSVLKVDRSFVRDMLAAPQNANLVKAIVQMAHSLNLQVTAEGIETEDQLAALRALGCDTGQGYGLGRPMEALALAQRLQEAAALPA